MFDIIWNREDHTLLFRKLFKCLYDLKEMDLGIRFLSGLRSVTIGGS